MAFHFVPWVDRVAPLGSIGVRLFFALSGFLITRILLAARAQPLAEAARAFYIRRAVRIFPVFYLVLAAAALIDIGPVRSTIGWHVTYLTNVYLFDRGSWHGSISHLWSLAVEEQFYLVWPWVVLLLPQRRLPALITTMIVAAPLSRLLVGGAMNSVLPSSCIDSLGAGALLALPSTRQQVIRAGRMVGVPLLIAALAIRIVVGDSVPLEIALDFSVSLTAAWIVGRAAEGYTGWTGALLLARPVTYVGTISYGLYLYHGFMPYVLGRYVPDFIELHWVLRAAMLTIATFIVASLSWKLVEAPLVTQKDRWAQRSPARKLPAVAA